MRRGSAFLVAVAALVVGSAAMVAPSVSEAFTVTISSVSVTVGDTTWCTTNLACTHPIWNLSSGVNLANFGDSLILTQTGGQNNFNFDTSEGNVGGAPCTAAAPCSTTIVVNGFNVGTNNNLILANGNADPGNVTHNEAANYAAYGATAFFNVFTGYADNVHTNICADADGNCQPDPFAASATNTFIGGGTTAPAGFNETQANHCTSNPPGANDCFDSGVIRILNGVAGGRLAVPEPSTLLLLGVGMMGLAAWRRSSESQPPSEDVTPEL